MAAISMRQATMLTAAPRISARPSRAMTVRVRAAGVINDTIKKDVDKVVDSVKAGDIQGKGVFCRCWKSTTFPKCNGAHAKHNKETGDNVGPLIIEAAAPAPAA